MGYLEIIGGEWKAKGRDLAEWALERLVNRTDVWGQYTGLTAAEKAAGKKKAKALTLPARDKRGQDMVTLEKLTRHFGSGKRHHLIGLHSASAEATSRWFAVDIDLHDPEAVDAEDGARRNFAAALGWWEALQNKGYDPLLLDSNGAGGYHLWTLLSEPAPLGDVFAFAQELVSDWEGRNLDAPPETFPKSGVLEADKLGAWLRLPGLHHTRDHFTKVWSGDPWLDAPWEEGSAAIEAILRAVPGAPPPQAAPADGMEVVTPKAGKRNAKRKKAKPKGGFASKKRPVVCVDLDGVFAEFGGWVGEEHFGDPIGGAVEFTRRLSELADLVIHTSRTFAQKDQALSVDRVRKWLDAHGFAYQSVFEGEGKPLARAYIDDRAVRCRPQEDGPGGFFAAEERVRELIGIDGGGSGDQSLTEVAELWGGLSPSQRDEIVAKVKEMQNGKG